MDRGLGRKGVSGVGRRCERCGEGSIEDDGLPDQVCWDHRATPAEVHAWIGAARGQRHYAQALKYVREIGDPRAAEALRSYAEDDDARIVWAVVKALGWSGDDSDEPLLLRLESDHGDARVRAEALTSLVELGTPSAADVVASRLAEALPGSAESDEHLVALAWLRDERGHEPLREIARAWDSPRQRDINVPAALLRYGADEDRELLAKSALAAVRAGAIGTSHQPDRDLRQVWRRYEFTVGRDAPDEVEEAKARLSADDIAWLWPHRAGHSGPMPVFQPLGPRVVPSLAMVAYKESPSDAADVPAKFLGQPDWRGEPTWPIGGDGVPLMFFGQLPLDHGERTAYIFLAGPDEWQPLGPGNAVVVQPGPPCHLPTHRLVSGPQAYEWVEESPPRFRRRTRRAPAPSKFPVFKDGLDPEAWEYPPDQGFYGRDPEGDWNKIGGTPRWLQGEESPPGDGWQFAFQFSADSAAVERGDGAECYGWLHPDGRAAFGWQCH